MLFYLAIIQTVLLAVIAAGTGFLVYRSLRSTRGTRGSLHSRRREVYNDVAHILTVLGRKGEARKDELLDFRSRTQDAALLFDNDVAAFIDEIYVRGVKLMSTTEMLSTTTLPVGEERDRITVENTKQMIWLADQFSQLGKKFERYPGIRPEEE